MTSRSPLQRHFVPEDDEITLRKRQLRCYYECVSRGLICDECVSPMEDCQCDDAGFDRDELGIDPEEDYA